MSAAPNPWLSASDFADVHRVSRRRLLRLSDAGDVERRGARYHRQYRWVGAPRSVVTPAPALHAAVDAGAIAWTSRGAALLCATVDMLMSMIEEEDKRVKAGKRRRLSVGEYCRIARLVVGTVDRSIQGAAERSALGTGAGLDLPADGGIDGQDDQD